MKKLAVWVLCVMLAGWAMAEPKVTAGGGALIDGDSGRLLWGSNEDKMLPMASTTKIMTALLTLENADTDTVVTIPSLASGIPGTSIYLSAGEHLTVGELLLGLMIRSGNDAAVALADHVGGSVDGFVEMMNRRAEELGIDARFANPHGLDAEGHAASARAMCLLAREALSREDFAGIVSTQRAVIPWDGREYRRVLQSKNRLLWEYDGALGVKTGYTGRAGRCLVFAARRDGVYLIGTVLNCGNWFDAARGILDWGFSQYRRLQPLEAGETAGRIAVCGQEMDVTAGADVFVTAKSGDEVRVAARADPDLSPPVAVGDRVGTGYVTVNGTAEQEFPLLASKEIRDTRYCACLLRVLGRWAEPFP